MGGPRPLRPLQNSNANSRAAPRPGDTSKDPTINDISSAMSNLSFLKTRASVADFHANPSKLPRPFTPTRIPIMPEPISKQKSPPKSARFLTKGSITASSWDINEKTEDWERTQKDLFKSMTDSRTDAEKWKSSAKQARKTVAEHEENCETACPRIQRLDHRCTDPNSGTLETASTRTRRRVAATTRQPHCRHSTAHRTVHNPVQ
jgi:hypothetical protein